MILTEHDENDRFGYIWRAETENIHNPFMYAGEYHDDETGFIYLRNRYYDPDAKRFTQEDPIRDGLNWYAYCENNPVMFVDPTGNIRQPGYVKGIWVLNPDAYEFGICWNKNAITKFVLSKFCYN